MDKEYDYRIRCAGMKPSERLQKCFELSDWEKKQISTSILKSAKG